MTLAHTSFADLTDDHLLVEVKRLAALERNVTATLIESLMEIDVRQLHLREGCSSLFSYCTQVLHLAEGAAYNRIEVARAARRFPMLLHMLREGSLTLATARLLAPHLTDHNQRDVLTAARYKSKREVEILIAALNPKPAVRPTIRRLPAARAAAASPSSAPPASNELPPSKSAESIPAPLPPSRVETRSVCLTTPVAPERFKIQCTISGETHDKLRRAQALLRHTIASGDLSEVLDRALTVLLDQLERRRCAVTTGPRPPQGAGSRSRHIPAAVRRAVWKRDEARCAFIGTEGRCLETAFLEFHHVDPYALGGKAAIENIQLRCRAHNQYEASLVFDVARESSPGWPETNEDVLTRSGRRLCDVVSVGR